MRHEEIERQKRRLKRFWPVPIVMELGVGATGIWMGNVQLTVIGFGMAIYLWALRHMLIRLGRWP